MKSSARYQDDTDTDRFGRQVAARLSEATQVLPHHISERLRVARVQAMAKHKAAQASHAAEVLFQNGSAALGLGGSRGVWQRLASLMPLILLVAGLLLVDMLDGDSRAKELAEIDASILVDDLPPAAYTDPGFTQYLKSRLEQGQ